MYHLNYCLSHVLVAFVYITLRFNAYPSFFTVKIVNTTSVDRIVSSPEHLKVSLNRNLKTTNLS